MSGERKSRSAPGALPDIRPASAIPPARERSTNGRRPRALLSVADKTGIVDFARGLVELSYEIVSTGGTAKALRAGGIDVVDVASVTGFPEIMDGRVKTLHPNVHGGLLARTGVDDDVLAAQRIGLIDLLAVNLYPFEAATARADCTDAEAIENIDIGGPAMLRAAAKNHERVAVVVDNADYSLVLEALRAGDLPQAFRRELAVKAFSHTARYDAAISRYLRAHNVEPAKWPDPLLIGGRLTQPLRYGENPHQQAALYRTLQRFPGSVAHAEQLQGKELSFNNLVDADAALQAVKAFDACACVIVKHANPCGVAVAPTPSTAYGLAYRTDPTSAYGGVIALNRPLDEATAQAILERQFAEVIIAPEIGKSARKVLSARAAIRVLEAGWPEAVPLDLDWEVKTIEGGYLLQQRDSGRVDVAAAKVVTRRAPTAAELEDLKFAWAVVKFVKSNAIVYALGGATLGIGAGQPARVMSARIAALKAADAGLALRGAVMASDAFFPFRDGIDAAAEHGIGAVVQPGGSMRDEEVVRAADEHDLAMVFTGVRHFRH
jgi:phosphoribosylaminoimidazolecarboxamide formyltransferase / IMP cyclohydrolase